jgi:peptidoglycan/xylan/chitin deacetylase (PgdA/CDA1 family)
MHVRWTVGQGREETMDTLDWVADKNSKVYYTAEEIAQKILKFADEPNSGANGAVILFHLGTNRKDDFPHKKLPDIIDGLHRKGFKLVKVSEMIPEG